MDQNAMNIKNIVASYQKKIKELEEIIRQKDSEISILKNKIFTLNSNQVKRNSVPDIKQNMNFDNKNPMMNLGNSANDINLMFIGENNEQTGIIFDKYKNTSNLIEKYLMTKYNEINLRNFRFTFNNQVLIPGCSLERNGLSNNSTIIVQKKRLLNLIFYYGEKMVPLALEENTSVCMAIIYFLIEIDKEKYVLDLIDNTLGIILSINGVKINTRDKRTIREYFNQNNAKILVKNSNAIKG